ncbi:MAG: SDR family oxidoreductase, partial [Deltaproteobacteria bacterium]|nr:SDR family oxidoreductase [Deltaproteobacteria bacterium]
ELNRLLIPSMQRRQWGRVVHVSSIAAVRGRASLPYSTIKAALNRYVSTLGGLVAADGVVVTAVMPGIIRTQGGHWDCVCSDRPDFVERYLQERIAVRRFGTPEEIRNMVVFLCSERASFCAGALIPIDGGTW